MTEAEQWIAALNLSRHPEGGWYREVYRAAEQIPRESLPSRFTGDRCLSTAIYFLLSEQEFSALHRIRQDELWHFYAGTALTIHTIDPAGSYSAIRLGRDVRRGESLMAVIPAGWLFGASLQDQRGYALAGCTVAPGFDFDDFEMPPRSELLRRLPQHAQLIRSLTRPS